MVAKPLCPLYKNIIKPLDRARYPELRYLMNEDLKNAYELAGGRNQSAVFGFHDRSVKKTFALEINRFTASQKRNFSFLF